MFDAAGVDLPDVAARLGPRPIGPEPRRRGPRSASSLGLRRFAGGVHLEAARVDLDGEPPIEIPLGDLERIG